MFNFRRSSSNSSGGSDGTEQEGNLERCLAFFVPAERAWKQLVKQRQMKPFNSSNLADIQEVEGLYYEALEQGVKICREENVEAVKREIQRTILEPMMCRTEELNREIKSLQGVTSSTSEGTGVKKSDHHNYYDHDADADENETE